MWGAVFLRKDQKFPTVNLVANRNPTVSIRVNVSLIRFLTVRNRHSKEGSREPILTVCPEDCCKKRYIRGNGAIWIES